MMPASDFAVLVVTCNGLNYTKSCLDSIQPLHKHTLVIDNGSTDSTQQWLLARAQRNHYYAILLSKFDSLAAAWNKGLSWLFQDFPYVLVINNDTELLPSMGEDLSQMHRNRVGGVYGIVSGISVRGRAELVVPEILLPPSPHPDFSCFMISRECYNFVGKFDESFKGAYCEDCDYHVRMHRKGLRAVSINYPFLHHGSGTLNTTADSYKKQQICELADANRQLHFAKWGAMPGTAEYTRLFDEKLFGIDRS